MKKRRKLTQFQKDKKKCDLLFAELVRARGYCQNCGASPPTVTLNCAHIISRVPSATRTNFRNAWCLCAGCHMRFHRYPDEHMAFVERTIGLELYYEMKVQSNIPTHVDWTEELQRLRLVAQVMEVS